MKFISFYEQYCDDVDLYYCPIEEEKLEKAKMIIQQCGYRIIGVLDETPLEGDKKTLESLLRELPTEFLTFDKKKLTKEWKRVNSPKAKQMSQRLSGILPPIMYLPLEEYIKSEKERIDNYNKIVRKNLEIIKETK